MKKYSNILFVLICFIFFTGFRVVKNSAEFENTNYIDAKTYAGTSNSTYNSSYPSSYDSRTVIDTFNGNENQSSLNLCWAFTSNNLLEAYLKKNNLGDYNFSENQPDYLARYLGDTSEFGAANSPYNVFKYWTYGLIPTIESVFGSYILTQQNKSFDSYMNRSKIDVKSAKLFSSINWDTFNEYTDSIKYYTMDAHNEPIKEYIYKHGAAFAIIQAKCIKDDNWCYNDGTLANDSAHAVTLIGWDDDYEYTGSYNHAPYKGAWLAYNSWGTKNKYFYISYYDKAVVKTMLGVSSVEANPTSWDNSYIVGRSDGAVEYSNDNLNYYYNVVNSTRDSVTYRYYIGDDVETLDSIKLFYLGFTTTTPSTIGVKLTVNSYTKSVNPSFGINTYELNGSSVSGYIDIKIQHTNSTLNIKDMVYTLVLRTKSGYTNQKILIGGSESNNIVNQVSNKLTYDIATKNIDAKKASDYTVSVYDKDNNNITSLYAITKDDLVLGRTRIVLTQNSNITYDKVFLKVFVGSIMGTEEIVYNANSTEVPTYTFESGVTHDETNKIVIVSPNMSASALIGKVTNSTVTVVNASDSPVLATDRLATNYKLVIVNNGSTYKYTISVLGDVNADGKVSVSDAVLIAKQSIKNNIFSTNVIIKAGDVNKDGKISISDAVLTAKYSIKGVGL